MRALITLFLGCGGPPPADLVVVVSLDTLRADRLGAYGSTAGLTPNLDRFAAEAVTFDQAFATSNETLYSHASLFTGRLPAHLDTLDASFSLPAGAPAFAETLAAGGWDTAAFVAGGHLAKSFGLSAGFRVYDDSAAWGSLQDTVPPALAWLDRRDAAAPALLFVHGYDTHDRTLKPTPFGYARASARREGVGAELVRVTGAASRVLDGHFLVRMDLARRMSLAQPRFARGRGLAAADPDATPLTPNDIGHVAAVYDGAVMWADVWLGLLLAGLEARGLLDNATILVLSDHGEELGEDGTFSHRYSLVDATLRVPLMVRLPGGAGGGRRVTGLVELTDIAPTLLSLAGLQAPANLDGRSLVPALVGNPWAGRAWATSEGALRLRSVRGPAARLTAEGLTAGNPLAPALLAVAPVDGVSLTLVGDEREIPALRVALVSSATAAAPSGVPAAGPPASKLPRPPARPPWTELGALAGHHRTLDTDGDGRITKEEWDPSVWNGPGFWSADVDGDGDVSAAELLVLVRAQPAGTFDAPGAPDDTLRGAGESVRPVGAARDIWEVAVWMSDALRAVGSEGADPAAVKQAVDAGTPDSDAVRALFGVLRPRWEAQGWAWPVGFP